MGEGVSRRQLVAAIGAGMAVSACGRSEGEDQANEMARPGPGGRKTCDNLGADPHLGPKVHFPNVSLPPFNPQYIAILCIELTPDWTVAVNHANFRLEDKERTEVGRANKAIAAIAESWKDEANPRKRLKENPTTKPRKRVDGSDDDHLDFEKFRFHRPIELFVYIYKEKRNNQQPVAADGRLLSFGSLMQQKLPGGAQQRAVGNCSYFNASKVNLSRHHKLNSHGFMFRAQNWALTEEGQPVGREEVLHSMNIHFSIPLDGRAGLMVPMVLDPDTGNGTGNEP